jgi:hypothetical protein
MAYVNTSCSQARFAIDPLVIDHIQPVSRGGKTIAENLALSCQTCNNYKYTKTEAVDPVTNQSVSLFHPRKWRSIFNGSIELGTIFLYRMKY